MNNNVNGMDSFYDFSSRAAMQNRRFKPGAGTILGLLSAVSLFMGIKLPIIDLSCFNENIEIKYNLIKLCKNVRLISPIWTGIPAGFWIGIIFMAALAFVKIPQFRLIPCVIILSMLIVMLADTNNLILWANKTLNSEEIQKLINQEFLIDMKDVVNSIRSGAYFIGAGLLTGFVSCFIRGRDNA